MLLVQVRIAQTKWLDQATTMIQDVFCNEANPISLEPWQNKTINSDTKKMTKIPDLNPAILQSICSPKISTIGSHNMFICRLAHMRHQISFLHGCLDLEPDGQTITCLPQS
jgi:hypothetical protein